MKKIMNAIRQINWQLYITREINVVTEHAMHEGWLAFTKKVLGRPLLKRVNLYTDGVANIFVSSDDIQQYKTYISKRYQADSLDDLYTDCMAICQRADREIQKYVSYERLREIAKSLAAPLILPRLVELTLTEKLGWQNNLKIQKLLRQYSALNEYRRPLVSEKIYPRFTQVLPKPALFLLPDEIHALINGSLPMERASTLSRLRCKRSAYITIDGTTTIITKNVDDIASLLLTTSDHPTKGSCASKGVIRGKSRIVIKASDYQKIQPGDILVTTMTQPDIAPYLNKISGLITDDGGVLCHAAILAREYGIPCLTATKFATQVLQDNDAVFLDATNGFYKKL
ncbi:MAG TPA: PEP-utilizing enzyme [Patescibacteria group bacterium]|nr:PEP-utilizing enzyme [Patescibacteria group bacterium]